MEPIVVTKRKSGNKKGIFGNSNRKIVYRCSVCLKDFTKTELFTKTVLFATLGTPSTRVKTRTVKWLCQPCMEVDEDFIRRKFADSPGMADVDFSEKAISA